MPLKKTTQLKHLINSSHLEFIMEAHNGISAKIVEEVGFKGIWGGGLSISAALGVRDNNEASWTQVLEVIEFMSDGTSIPILLDGDTGFGDFNNVRRLIRKLEQRHVAGVCIEDKLYPKANSFINGDQQPLADMIEFCGKIKAAKDSQTDADFCVVARVEALIAGWGIQEALKRAYAYADAGADAILIHSKRKDPSEILEFMKGWDKQKPVVIVPTTYGNVGSSAFEEAGVSLVVWANHALRASVTAMQKTIKQIHDQKSIQVVDKQIVPIDEIFRLQNMQELAEAERLYRPQTTQGCKAIILGASRGAGMDELTKDRPKCMIEVHGKPILSTLVFVFNANQIKDITAVAGYKKETINLPNVKTVVNNAYETTGILQSLYEARGLLNGPVVICYGDILFAKEVLRDLLDVSSDIVLAVDTAWIQGEKKDRLKDMVFCQEPHSQQYLSKTASVVTAVATQKDKVNADGEWIGLVKLTTQGASLLRLEMEQFLKEDPHAFRKADLVSLFARLVQKKIVVTAAYHAGHWLDIDTLDDLLYANSFFLESGRV